MTTVFPKQNEDDSSRVVFSTRLGHVIDDYFIPNKYAPWVERWSDAQEMFKAAQNNPALDDLLKQAEMLYALTK
jgi:hypothetical protein